MARLNTIEATRAHTLKLLTPIFERRAPWMVGDAIARAIGELYTENELYIRNEPSLEYEPYLTRMQARLSSRRFIEKADEATLAFLDMFVANLPTSAFEEARDLTNETFLPLYMLYPHARAIPSMPDAHFLNPVVDDIPVFATYARTSINNAIRASGYDPATYDGSRRLKSSADYDGSTEELLNIYLRDTPFLDLFTDYVPFSIPTDRFGSHGIIIAPPEHGKTQLLTSFIKRFLDDGETGMVVLDPHGDLFNSLKDKIPPERRVILDPSTDPPALNVFDFGGAHQVQILQAFTYLMAALTGGMSEKQLGILPYLLKLIRLIPKANVATLLKLVTERPKTPTDSQFYEHVLKLPDIDRDFFVSQFLGNKMADTKDAIAWKLSSALSYDAFREMFTAEHNSFDAFEALQQQKVVLVKGSERVLGEQGLSVFLQFIVAQFFLAALRRDEIPERDRKLCVLFADEASHVFNSQTTRILTECRKYRLGFLAATQVIQQIPQDVRRRSTAQQRSRSPAPSHTPTRSLCRAKCMPTLMSFAHSSPLRAHMPNGWCMSPMSLTRLSSCLFLSAR